jgi:hypothetical protein
MNHWTFYKSKSVQQFSTSLGCTALEGEWTAERMFSNVQQFSSLEVVGQAVFCLVRDA